MLLYKFQKSEAFALASLPWLCKLSKLGKRIFRGGPLLALMLTLSASYSVSAEASGHSRTQKTQLLMGAVLSKDNTYLGRLGYLIYSEVFRRLDMELVYDVYPPKRASWMAEHGELDGEIGRAFDYQDSHPNLIRIEEPIFSVTLSAFAVEPITALNGWNSLKATGYRVGYRSGYTVTEDKLSNVLPKDKLSGVAESIHGLRKLSVSRTDVYVDIKEHIERILKLKEFDGIGITNVGEMEVMKVYGYLHKRHKDLVPRIAAMLKVLKREGVIPN